MSTNFNLGLDLAPDKLFMGMDQTSFRICGLLQEELGFPRFIPALPGSTAWTSKHQGVIATIRYAEERLVTAMEDMFGLGARLFVGLRPAKQFPRTEALHNLFSVVAHILANTRCDAVLHLEWDYLVLRRILGEISIYNDSGLFRGGMDSPLLVGFKLSCSFREKSAARPQ